MGNGDGYSKGLALAVKNAVPMSSLYRRGGFIEILVSKLILQRSKRGELDAIILVSLFDEACNAFLQEKPISDQKQWEKIFALRGWEMMLALKGHISPSWVVEDAVRILSCRFPQMQIPVAGMKQQLPS